MQIFNCLSCFPGRVFAVVLMKLQGDSDLYKIFKFLGAGGLRKCSLVKGSDFGYGRFCFMWFR